MVTLANYANQIISSIYENGQSPLFVFVLGRDFEEFNMMKVDEADRRDDVVYCDKFTESMLVDSIDRMHPVDYLVAHYPKPYKSKFVVLINDKLYIYTMSERFLDQLSRYGAQLVDKLTTQCVVHGVNKESANLVVRTIQTITDWVTQPISHPITFIDHLWITEKVDLPIDLKQDVIKLHLAAMTY